jgi:hypothetical protein
MTRRDGSGSIKEDGGKMGYTRRRGRSLPFAIDAALVRIINSSGLFEAHQPPSSTFLIEWA